MKLRFSDFDPARILYEDEDLVFVDKPEGVPSQSADPSRRLAELSDEYRERLMSPFGAAERGWVDAVIEPSETRRLLCRALKVLATKREDIPRRKHANNPL